MYRIIKVLFVNDFFFVSVAIYQIFLTDNVRGIYILLIKVYCFVSQCGV